jgi:hypothetical protein
METTFIDLQGLKAFRENTDRAFEELFLRVDKYHR